MTTKGAKQDDLAEACLVAADAAETPVDRRPWRREGIYVGPICVAVHLSVVAGTRIDDDRSLGEAKEALFRYLRQAHQVVLDHGIVLPLAAVIERSGASSGSRLDVALATWGSDQGWHRGGFTLYVEDGGDAVGLRLQDLVSRNANVMDVPQDEWRDDEWYALELEKTVTSKKTLPRYSEAVGACIRHLRQPAVEKEAGVRIVRNETVSPLEYWVADSVRLAHSLLNRRKRR